MKQKTEDEILKALKESVEIQKDIRSILLHCHKKQLSNETGVPLVDDDGEEKNPFCYSEILFYLRIIDEITSQRLRSKEIEQELRIKKISRESQRDSKKLENFWYLHLSRKDYGKSASTMLLKGQFTYADLLEVLIQEHDWNKNTTRAVSELETQIRRSLRGCPRETKDEFQQFFDEANKSKRRNFRRVTLSYFEFMFISSFLEEKAAI